MRKIETAGKWAEVEFGGVELGDARRTARVIKVAERLARSPGGTLPGPLPSWAEMKAAYRLLENPAVTHARLQQPHWEHTRQDCAATGEYLLLEDTTPLDYTGHPETAGLGRIGDNRGRGFYVHSTLALRIEKWNAHEPSLNLLGLFWQQLWDAGRQTEERSREKKSARAEAAARIATLGGGAGSSGRFAARNDVDAGSGSGSGHCRSVHQSAAARDRFYYSSVPAKSGGTGDRRSVCSCGAGAGKRRISD